MKKRVLSLFMALALCFSMLPTAALAEEAGAAPDAANADSTYTTGEDAGLAGGEDDSAPEDTDSGEAQDGEADTAVSAVQGASHASHCVCGGNGDVNGHNHDTAGTEWKTADSLPNSAGSYYLDAERRLFVPCEKVQAVDTTAAGDTYSGYFLASLCSGSSVEDAMRLATKAAGIAVQRKGAAASIPEIKELK